MVAQAHTRNKVMSNRPQINDTIYRADRIYTVIAQTKHFTKAINVKGKPVSFLTRYLERMGDTSWEDTDT